MAELIAWREETPYAGYSDYAFASFKMKGKQPHGMSTIMQLHQLVAVNLGILLKGWHALRRS